MTDKKKKRLSMLDNLTAGAAPTPGSLMSSSRPLRAARDAVDSHKVWELDPAQIVDTRVADRLSHEDVAELRESIETTGQTVPILLRRHASDDDKFLLVYGRRRLEAIRSSSKVNKVRALVASMDDASAIEAQISENMARRDLSYIEKALFAHELIKNGFGNQSRVAEVLTVTKSSVSMSLAIVEAIGTELIQAIGPAQTVGRPKWDAMAKALTNAGIEIRDLIESAENARNHAQSKLSAGNDDQRDPSSVAFDAVLAKLVAASAKEKPHKAETKQRTNTVRIDSDTTSKVTRTSNGLKLEVVGQDDFANWAEDQAQDVIKNLYARWKQQSTK